VKDASLRRMARRMGAQLARRWRRYHLILPSNADADTVTDYVVADDAAEGLNVPDKELKEKLKRAASRFSARDFLKFDPLSEPPPVDVPDECQFDGTENPRGSKICRVCKRPLTMLSRYDVWYDALTTTHSGDRCGIKLGARLENVLNWLPSMRPYPGSENGANPEFVDAVYAITHIVYTLNDYNSCKLSPEWLPEEYDFLKASLQEAIRQENEDMLGEVMDSLRAFGLTEDDEIIREGMEYLLSHQNADGSWGTADDDDIYSLYHPTWCAINALSEYAWQGYSSKLQVTYISG
jgi:hypothetical protein